METLVFAAGLLVSLLFSVGYVLYKKELISQRERDRKKKSNNEYRTNEEFISYP
ncbi:hypothetical protein [Fodinibius sp.]|uniref:hypothetical protein n=1 Tax=Fodinibius sp. TaxID=1872440 RepID=UPI002ACD4D88|nr:hypothetical protein [Fodinibius sp.]MDZ7660146.1 hypothetical protein [Fodinibius sp.]